jgi:hypothetical protein
VTESSKPPRKWLAICEPWWKNHSDGGAAMRSAVARENDPAEALGFECVPDPKRGHGYCFFTRKNAAGFTITVRSAWIRYDNVLYPWGCWVRDDKLNLAYVTLYDRLEDALHDRNRRVYGKPLDSLLISYAKVTEDPVDLPLVDDLSDEARTRAFLDAIEKDD